MIKKASIVSLAFLLLLCAPNVFAGVGVGVGIGKIVMDKPLSPGGSYTLPTLPVLNTGDESSQYTVMVEYRENVKELRPDKDWFSFDPSSFVVEPDSSQNVDVTLTLPLDAVPGDYFAFLQAKPIKDQDLIDNSNTSVNIAAASKLYFTIAPSNIFQAVYYKAKDLYDKLYPYDAMVLGFIVFATLVFVLKDRFSINISSKAKKEDNDIE